MGAGETYKGKAASGRRGGWGLEEQELNGIKDRTRTTKLGAKR